MTEGFKKEASKALVRAATSVAGKSTPKADTSRIIDKLKAFTKKHPIATAGAGGVAIGAGAENIREKIANTGTLLTLAGGAAGNMRANKLTTEEEANLKEYYGRREDSNLALRNFGRGAGGAYVGGAVGGTAAIAPEYYKVLKSSDGDDLMRFLMKAPRKAPFGIAAGGALGAYLATNKYSPQRAQAIEKRADAIIGPIVGAIRAEKDPEKKRALARQHGLPDDANLTLRNAGRGFIGGGLGGVLGSRVGGLPLGIAGAITGAILSTKKYSKSEGNKALLREKHREKVAQRMAEKIYG